MIRLVYDECTPTRYRRPTTMEDIENDVHVEEYDSIPEMIDDFVSEGYEDFAEDEGIDPKNEMKLLEAWLGYYNDPGDGSPNILYISIDGVPYESENILTYDCLQDVDLEHAREADIKALIIQAYDDLDEEDDMDESLNEASEENYEINYSCWMDKDGTWGLDGDFDTEEEAIEFCKENNYYSVEKQYYDGNERVKTEEVFINPDYFEDDDYDNDEYLDDDEYVDDEEEETESEPWYKGIDDEGDTDFVVDEEVFEDNDDYINEKLNYVISKKIRILKMEDPIDNKRYAGKEGIIKSIETDGFGDTQYWGTWGNVAVYPDYDKIEFIDNESLEEDLVDDENNNKKNQNKNENLSEDVVNKKGPQPYNFEDDNYKFKVELYTDDESFDINTDYDTFEYFANLNIEIEPKNIENSYVIVDIPVSLGKDFTHRFVGEYYPETRWEPAEYPDLEVEVDKSIEDKDVEIDFDELEITDSEGIDDVDSYKDNVVEYLKNNSNSLKKCVINNESYIYDKFYDEAYELEDEFRQSDEDKYEPDYDEDRY